MRARVGTGFKAADASPQSKPQVISVSQATAYKPAAFPVAAGGVFIPSLPIQSARTKPAVQSSTRFSIDSQRSPRSSGAQYGGYLAATTTPFPASAQMSPRAHVITRSQTLPHSAGPGAGFSSPRISSYSTAAPPTSFAQSSSFAQAAAGAAQTSQPVKRGSFLLGGGAASATVLTTQPVHEAAPSPQLGQRPSLQHAVNAVATLPISGRISQRLSAPPSLLQSVAVLAAAPAPAAPSAPAPILKTTQRGGFSDPSKNAKRKTTHVVFGHRMSTEFGPQLSGQQAYNRSQPIYHVRRISDVELAKQQEKLNRWREEQQMLGLITEVDSPTNEGSPSRGRGRSRGGLEDGIDSDGDEDCGAKEEEEPSSASRGRPRSRGNLEEMMEDGDYDDGQEVRVRPRSRGNLEDMMGGDEDAEEVSQIPRSRPRSRGNLEEMEDTAFGGAEAEEGGDLLQDSPQIAEDWSRP